SLLLTAAPVAAITQPGVTFTPTAESVISQVNAGYVISFRLVDALVPTDKIVVTFPEGTIVDAVPTVTIEGWCTPTLTYRAVASPVAAGDVDTLEVELTWSTDGITSLGTVKVTFLTGIKNPNAPGTDYTLTVGTQDTGDTVIEAAATSAEYEITPPEPATPAGVVQLWNDNEILMENYTGDWAIDNAYSDAGDDYVIKVGAGRYVYDNWFDTDVEGVTIVSAAGAADTTIVGDTFNTAVYISDEGVTLDGFTIHGDGDYAVEVNSVAGDKVTIKNCVFLEEGEAQTDDHMYIYGAEDVVVQDCTFTVEDTFVGIYADVPEIKNCDFTVEDGGLGIYIDSDGVTVTDCTFTGSSGAGIYVYYDGTVEGCIFDGLETAIEVDDPGTVVTIESNIFQNGADGAAILVTTAEGVVITNNTFTANADYVLDVVLAPDVVFMNFNSILGSNTGDDDGIVLTNAVTGTPVNVQANWWDDAAGPDEAIFSDADDFTYEPFLVAATSGDGTAATDTNDFDDEADTGVTVTVTAGNDTDDDADGIIDDMNVVGAATYAANPAGTAPTGAIGFWDIFVGSTEDDVTELTIRIYTDVTLETEVHVWAEGKGEWLPADATPNLFGGFMTIVVDADSTPTIEDLAGLPFAVVE
ncbi:MAG: right-handed parallel beta-helix repeat-containing protein, partial [Dehalococcoidia bacterium]|nr:right-handed parallel beta-helix repeat-containing protein [Dehalococcoidia bacterium]